MRYGSLFSGIGGFDLGFEQAGLECAWQCEIDKKARSVLEKHWPNVPCIEDVRNVTRDNVPTVDIVCGGFPCQDLSVAGKRAGLAGERSGLWFEFHRVVAELKPKWVIVENVPGLLSSNGGADFAIILRGLVECGYGVTWRILDAQYFGVAQRRRRVFIVGSLGDGRAAEVLFEREGLFGHPPARRAAGQRVAGTLGARTDGGGFPGTDESLSGYDVPAYTSASYGGWREGFGTLRANGGDLQGGSETLICFDVDRDGQDVTFDLSPTLKHGGSEPHHHNAYRKMAVAYGGNNTSDAIDLATAVTGTLAAGAHPDSYNGRDAERNMLVIEPRYARNGRGAPDTIAPPLKAQNGGTGKGDGAPVVAIRTAQTGSNGWGVDESGTSYTVDSTGAGALSAAYGVRRLTPTECERLQGFPDGWTAGQSDSIRYRQLGNAVAVPVARWIGHQLLAAMENSA